MQVFVPNWAKKNNTLNFDIESVRVPRSEFPLFRDLEDKLTFNGEEIDYDYFYPSINTSGPAVIELELDRKLSKEFIENLESKRMLGFKVTWNYDREFKTWAKFSNEDRTKEFVR